MRLQSLLCAFAPSRKSRRNTAARFGGLAVPLAFVLGLLAFAPPRDVFVIRVVDAQSGRGVPLVELRTTNDIAFVTDSNGIVAFREPGLMDRRVFFTITSPGYEYPADGFGYRGLALQTTSGGTATLKINRINIAERLYRQTGEGIYRDSVLAGIDTPLKHPLLDGDVMGQDSVIAVPYRGAIHWFWGDTGKPGYPLGNFGMTGAITPTDLDPDRGIDFSYFTGADGFARPMIPIDAPGPVWLTGIAPVDRGTRMIGYYTRVKTLAEAYERGLALYNDRTDRFDPILRFDVKKPLPLDGHPFLAQSGRRDYIVGTVGGASPMPWARVPAALDSVKDLRSYEYFTCLKRGPDGKTVPDRDGSGRLLYGWKPGGPPITYDAQQRLVRQGSLKAAEGPFHLRDADTGRLLRPHNGSVCWNAYAGRWLMTFGEVGGDVSNLGEIWLTEADSAVGPWVYARKIATHPHMDFYNPTQQPFLDRDEGRKIYFEGTYVNTFSGNPIATPRYNYNNLMYRLLLDDPRLTLPLPVYERASGGYGMRPAEPTAPGALRRIAFYAVPPPHPHAGLVAVYHSDAGFQTSPPAPDAAPLCFALPLDRARPGTEPLTDRDGKPIARVWTNPESILIADFGIRPAPQSR
ncbi:MAG TPA: hypothetical protein VKT77_15625 [Chthonomonadaceae bacterium]|nr:hypothetical protein [Chthonomonadaceae bacterium]